MLDYVVERKYNTTKFDKINNLISKTTINNIYEAARVEEVISDFISLKKAGSNFKGLSPFSQKKLEFYGISSQTNMERFQ